MRGRRRGEHGTVMMITALISLGSLLMVGLVLDLGELRADRRVNKGVTDMAARAGVGRLPFGPWNGVCKARAYLLGNAGAFSSFDAGSETWSRASGQVIGSDPCPAVAVAEDANPCLPNVTSTWAKLQATADGGRFTIEIQSGYALPDNRFPEDAELGDTGAAALGGCDNLAVILTERQAPAFAQTGGAQAKTVRVRSVARLNAEQTLDFVAALQLLERHDCDVLTTGGSGTKVIAQPYNAYPGTIQIDSDGGAQGDCTSNKRILVGQDTTGGGTIVACSANQSSSGCTAGTGNRPSRIGIYAVNFKPASQVTTNFATTGPTSYGDTKAIASPRTGRKYVDQRYRQNVAALDQTVKSMLSGTNPYPPGCVSISISGGLGTCIGYGVTWLVVENCSTAMQTALNLDLVLRASQNIWFRCDLDVATPLQLTGADAFVVVTGSLAVNSTFTIRDPRQVYIGGRSTGNAVGLDLTGGGTLSVNAGGQASCDARSGPGHANRVVVGKGSLKVGSGFTFRMCQTFLYLASGYDKVPASDGTIPCKAACSNLSGTISVSSGALSDLSAPNEITGRFPTPAELANTNRFEDLGLWTEAGGNTNGMAGGASTSLTGVFFLPNAEAFNLTGGGSLPVRLSAQFVSTKLKVAGNATINLVPNPEDSIPVTIYTILLVR